MGDTKKQRKKYRGPQHPWQKSRIDEEKIIFRDYGLKNKKEIWRMHSKLKNFAQQAKHLNSLPSNESGKERVQLLEKLQRIGLLNPNSRLDDVLSLTLKDILERRLQTIVYRKGFSSSIKEARQFITHKHIKVNRQKVTSPSYLVKVDDQDKINFAENSALYDINHMKRLVGRISEKIETKTEVKTAVE